MKARISNANGARKERNPTIAQVTPPRSIRESNPSSEEPRAAFTLTELCVVIACIAVLATLVLPALATSKIQSASAGCLYNLRHLMVGWEMYRTENRDYLMPNAVLGLPNNQSWCGGSSESWGAANANTNPVPYTSSLMWPYVNNNLSVYRCPGDVVPSTNGTRIRSYSMNSQVGHSLGGPDPFPNYDGARTYGRGSDIVSPIPANLFVFADESPCSLNDGYLQVNNAYSSGVVTFPDVPACYLEGGCGLSFADGHGEIHHWQTPVLRVRVQFGFTINNLLAGRQNADWIWFTEHAASSK